MFVIGSVTWALPWLQLSTDDSFQFNRVVGVIKRHVVALPEASSDDDAIMAALQVAFELALNPFMITSLIM